MNAIKSLKAERLSFRELDFDHAEFIFELSFYSTTGKTGIEIGTRNQIGKGQDFALFCELCRFTNVRRMIS